MSKAYCTICCTSGHSTRECLAGAVATVERRGGEQRSARQAHNLEVVGSNPTPATTFTPSYDYLQMRVGQLEGDLHAALGREASYERENAALRAEIAQLRAVGPITPEEAPVPETTTTELQAYCTKCRTNRPFRNPVVHTNSKGQPYAKGDPCEVCGTALTRMGKLPEA